VIFDLDGVVYLGRVGVEGAGRALSDVEQRGYRVLFCTNNSSRTRSAAMDKIRRATGYPARIDQVFTSAMAGAQLLREQRPPSLVLGGPGIVEALQRIGAPVVDDWREARAVVVGLAPQLTYDLLRQACQAVWAGARLIATNTDPCFPTDQGMWPAAGSIVAAVEYATGQPAQTAGKPHQPMIDVLKEHVSSEKVIMVGDQPGTDLQMAVNAGWYSVLTLSGATKTPPDSPRPDAVIDSIVHLPTLLADLESKQV
jgi:4-nitrophenyl phosphatase